MRQQIFAKFDSYLSSLDEGPGIEGFQITGDAKPGGRILGCGYPVRGTTLCMFQVKQNKFLQHPCWTLLPLSSLIKFLTCSHLCIIVGSSSTRWDTTLH